MPKTQKKKKKRLNAVQLCVLYNSMKSMNKHTELMNEKKNKEF